MGEKPEDENIFRDESSLLFEELGSVPIKPLSDDERLRILSEIPSLDPQSPLWDHLADIRSIFADLYKRSQDRRVGNDNLLKKRRPAATAALEKVVEAADGLCQALDGAPEDVRSLLGRIDLSSRTSFEIRTAPGKLISLNETELPNVTRDAAKLLASRAKELLPEIDAGLRTDRKLADREMAAEMLSRIWIKDFGLPIYLVMHDDAEEPQPFVRFVEAVLHDVEPRLPFEQAVRNIHRRMKALNRL